jgi:hypothetical protein
MVSVIHEGRSFRRVLNYNEQKIAEGLAVCLEAGYYLTNADQLTFNQKLFRLQNQAAKNTRTKVNTVHVSLNFDPSEQHDAGTLKAIATSYLEKIGFAEQPYLLYQHFDAGHPHIHILTTNIKADGKRISLHNLGKIHSEKARREIENDFGLVRAEDKINKAMYDLKPINTQVHYGKAATKRAVLNVLNLVFQEYKFCSLPELNAVLNLYNVAAERGSENSRVFKNGGLVYRVRDKDGNYQGVPIKASDFLTEPILDKRDDLLKPTLKTLKTYFHSHESARLPYKGRLKNAIDLTLLNNENIGLNGLVKELEQEGIDTVLRYAKDGKVFGITYVDHKKGCVFNGSALGKNYSASAILQRCGEVPMPIKLTEIPGLKPCLALDNSPQYTPAPFNPNAPGTAESMLNILLHPEQYQSYLPYELSGRKKIKKKTKQYRF